MAVPYLHSKFHLPSLHLEEKRRFARRNLHRLMIWPLLAVLIVMIGWVVLLDGLESERQKAELNGMHTAASLAEDDARDFFHKLEAINNIAFYIKKGWEESNGSLRLEDATPIKNLPEDSTFFISIIDETGNLVSTTATNVAKVNVANQAYFTSHLGKPDLFYIGPAQHSEFTKRPIIPFSRRLSDKQGKFKGIVLVSLLPNNFVLAYDAAPLKEEHGFWAVLDTNKIPLIARIGNQLLIPASSALRALPSFEHPSGSAVWKGSEWFSDQRDRYIGWETIDQYGTSLLVGLDQKEFLAPYSAQRDAEIKNAIVLSIALGLLALAATVSAVRHAWRKDQFEKMQATYRAATEDADEGFYIASPLRNKEGKVIDFRITDCNERGAAFLRYRREELIGRRVLALYHGEAATRIMRMLCHALENRSYEGETDMASLGLEGPAWLHIRISRPDNDLAISMRDISTMKAHMVELERRGNEDGLTGLPNRHWINGYLPLAIGQAAVAQTMLALLFVDLDGFKSVNDTMGHEAGDEVLRNAARRLKEAIRPHDHVVRLGGDEFLVVLEDVGGAQEASHVGERILDAFQLPFRVRRGIHSIGTSIGISLFPRDGSDAPTLLKNADIAMYSVKASGKRGYRFFDRGFSDALVSRHQKEEELRYALEHNQLVVFYQPKVDISTGVTSSLEALVRWAHPTRGIVKPNDFISVANEAGLIAKLGEQVIEKVCAQLAQWSKHSQELVPVSVNVCASQFHKSDIVGVISGALQRHGIAASLIEIEITESTMLEHTEDVIQSITSLQKMGIKLSVDDFGTGYSSLSQLQSLDFDVLKVDQAFTARLNHSKDGNILFTTIIKMAHSLGMRVVAEGVETLDQIKTLKAMHCDEIQGFYISQPVPPTETQPVLPRWFFPSTT